MKPSRLFRACALVVLLAALFGFTPFGVPRASAGGTGVIFTVTAVNEGSDGNLGDGICSTASDGSGPCTLRAAMEEANADPLVNTIQFALPGTGMHAISITSGPLPPINNQLNLDGTSQPNCTVPCIVLSGAALGLSAGVDIETSYSIVKGFVITSFGGSGMIVFGDGNVVQQNIIGFWPGNPTPLGNGGGISIVGSNNLIGGTAASQRNWVSGNAADGIILGSTSGMVTSGNLIEGNYIGTNRAGTAALGNGMNGIAVSTGVTNTTIGGTVAGARNVISGNHSSGIEVRGSGTVIQGNFIGTRADGTGSIPNTADGVNISAGPGSNLIGGAVNAAKNRITRNGASGIAIGPDVTGWNRIRRNWIFRNGGLGIDLNYDGVTPNDALDVDTGPNGLQNYPSVGTATSSTLVITGALRSQASSTYTIEFFSSPAGTCDGSQHGEGKSFLGAKSVTTDASGLARFRFLSPIAFATGSVITATATDASGNTSEFSVCRTAG